MYKRILGVTISALVLMSGVGGAIAQDRTMTPQPEQTQPHAMGQEGAGMMGQGMGGGMGRGMMGGMMGHGMMGGAARPHPVIMRILFALIDTDSDGTISLQEFQAAHERIFKAMDANKDGKLTLEEMEAFFHPH